MQQQKDMRLAVLIDADNAPRKSIKGVMEEIAVYGTPTIKRIYGDWTTPNLAGWKSALLENAITPIQQYGYTTGKNATDSAMIIDAMDILYSGQVDGFCLVSSDSDFTRLAIRLREAGMKVIGLGEKKTPNPFIVACDRFIYIEIITSEKKHTRRKTENTPPAAQEGAASHAHGTGKEKVPRGFVDLLAATIEDVADDEGWAYLGEVGSLLQKKQPDFDARNFGFKKLTLLVQSMDAFEVDFRQSTQQNNGKLIYIRNKRP